MSYKYDENAHELFRKEYTDEEINNNKANYEKFEKNLEEAGFSVVEFRWWAYGGITFKIRKEYGMEKYIADFPLLGMNDKHGIDEQAEYRILVDGGEKAIHKKLLSLDDFIKDINNTDLLKDFNKSREIIIGQVIQYELNGDYR